MDAAVCFSGGKDSALAALLLADFYDVTLVTATFGVTDDVSHGKRAADALGFPHQTIGLDRDVAEAAVDRMLADGFPRNGIQQVHEHAVEVVASGGDAADGGDWDTVADGGDWDAVADGGDWDAVADGIRRDDRVPKLDRSTAQSVEDRHDVSYVAPLAGIGRDAIDAMVDRTLRIETGSSEDIDKSDYESELRALIAERDSESGVRDIFPEHTQSRVLGRRDA